MMSPDEKLAYMANQIARNFQAQGKDAAVAATAQHIRQFWDPRMRSGIAALLSSGRIELSPIARAALEGIHAEAD